jgi:uncharacterized protein YchJ
MQQKQPYSITTSARASSPAGTLMPSAFAVVRLIASCARAATGQAVATQAILLMRSRRRMAFLKASDCAD